MEKELHRRLRQLRKAAGLTQEQVGKRFGLSKAAISYWETENPNKRTAPKSKMVPDLAKLYGVTPNELMGGAASSEAEHPASQNTIAGLLESLGLSPDTVPDEEVRSALIALLSEYQADPGSGSKIAKAILALTQK